MAARKAALRAKKEGDFSDKPHQGDQEIPFDLCTIQMGCHFSNHIKY